MRRRLSVLLIALMAIFIVPFSAYALNNSEMSVYFIDCGQGDAIFITSKDKTMLVDAGKASNVQKVLQFLDSQEISTIDYVFSSHPDEDHIGGMPEIYKNYQISNSLYSSYVADSGIYREYMNAVKSEPNSKFAAAEEDDTFTLGDTTIDVLSDGKEYTNANDASLVLKVTCGEKELLLTGDISQAVEQDLVDSGKDIDIDILKVGHHGSASSSSSEFLAEASPDVAVISVGKGNSYGHPTQQALNRLWSVCDNVYRTDTEGTILLKVSQNTVTYNNNILDAATDSYCTARTVYVTSSGSKYHASSACSNMKSPIAKSLTDVKKSGYTACSKCVSSDFETGKIPHTYTPAGCTKPRTCSACGVTRGSALGHSYTDACDSTCNNCNSKRSVTHQYKVTSTTKATLSKNGSITKKCSKCASTNKSTIYYAKTFSLSATSYTYNGKTKTPSVTVKDYKGKTLKKDTDYTVSYASGRKNAGTYKVTVKMKGNYSGEKILTFKINPISASKFKFSLSSTSYTYDGKTKTPGVTVKNANGTKLTKNTHYTVTYASGRKNVGTYKVTVKMKGNYSGTKTLTFKINPQKTSVSKLKAGKKSITAAISKKTSQVAGYQIQYSTSKTFSKAATKTISSYKTTKYTLKSLKAKKTYYVRVRTFKKVGSTTYYSGWSAYKYIKTK